MLSITKIITLFSFLIFFSAYSISQNAQINNRQCIEVNLLDNTQSNESFKILTNINDYSDYENLKKILNHSSCNLFTLTFDTETSEIILYLHKERAPLAKRNSTSWWNEQLATRCLEF